MAPGALLWCGRTPGARPCCVAPPGTPRHQLIQSTQADMLVGTFSRAHRARSRSATTARYTTSARPKITRTFFGATLATALARGETATAPTRTPGLRCVLDTRLRALLLLLLVTLLRVPLLLVPLLLVLLLRVPRLVLYRILRLFLVRVLLLRVRSSERAAPLAAAAALAVRGRARGLRSPRHRRLPARCDRIPLSKCGLFCNTWL